MQIKAQEISEIIKKKISDFEKTVEVAEVGTVITVGDGIASETIWDFRQKPLIGAGLPSHFAVEAVA